MPFGRYMDPRHRLYEPDSPFAKAIEEHYATLDREIGALLDILRPRPWCSSSATTGPGAWKGPCASTCG